MARRADGAEKLLGDKAYDGDVLRDEFRERGIEPFIPGKSSRERRLRYDKEVCK